MTINTPTLTVAADDTQARVTVTVDVSGTTTPQQAQVQRQDAGVWVDVRGWSAFESASPGSITFDDYEAASTSDVLYRARAVDPAAVTADSAWTASTQVTTAVPGWWLVDVLVPTLRVPLTVQWGDIPFRKTRDQGVFRPVGRSRAIVRNGVRRGLEFPLSLYVRGEAEHDALDAVVDAGRTCLLRDDMGKSVYVMIGATTPFTLKGTADRGDRSLRAWTLDLIEVDVP